jgi:hypothetical protein
MPMKNGGEKLAVPDTQYQPMIDVTGHRSLEEPVKRSVPSDPGFFPESSTDDHVVNSSSVVRHLISH